MQNYHVVKSTKSVGIGILLTLLLGPIGLFYATIWGGLIMTFTPIIIYVVVFTGIFIGNEFMMIIGGLTSLVYIIFWWLICIIWAAIAIKKYNQNLIAQSNSFTGHFPDYPGHRFHSNHGDHHNQWGTMHTNLPPPHELDNDVPDIQEWLKLNPGKGINDYYAHFRN